MKKELFFVYGTLKKGMNNHSVLKRLKATFISPVETIEKYPMFKLREPFPYLQDEKGKGKIIQGELWELDEDCISALDSFEGVPFLYKKGKIAVEFENDVFEEINVYFKAEEIPLNEIDLIDEWK